MLHLIFILLSIVSVLGFVPNESCFLNAKLDICAKFYPSAIKDCVKRMKPTYDKIKLELCGEDERQCFELRNICSDYRFVAVHLPGFPHDEEYEFSCRTPYFIIAGISSACLLSVAFSLFVVVTYVRLVRKNNMHYERLEEGDSVSREGSPILGRGFGQSNASAGYRPVDPEHPMAARKKDKEMKEMNDKGKEKDTHQHTENEEQQQDKKAEKQTEEKKKELERKSEEKRAEEKRKKEEKEQKKRAEEERKREEKEQKKRAEEERKKEEKEQKKKAEEEKKQEERKRERDIEEEQKKKESEKDKKFLGWFRNRVRKEKEFLVREEDEEDTEESDAEGEKEKGDEKKDEAREQQHIVESEKPKNSKTPREKETFTPVNLCPAYEDEDLLDVSTNAESLFSRTPPPMKPDGASARQPGVSKSKPTISLHDELEAAILKRKESLNRTMLEPESKWI